jgi:hypothetical protein
MGQPVVLQDKSRSSTPQIKPRAYLHPVTGKPIAFGGLTLEEAESLADLVLQAMSSVEAAIAEMIRTYHAEGVRSSDYGAYYAERAHLGRFHQKLCRMVSRLRPSKARPDFDSDVLLDLMRQAIAQVVYVEDCDEIERVYKGLLRSHDRALDTPLNVPAKVI